MLGVPVEKYKPKLNPPAIRANATGNKINHLATQFLVLHLSYPYKTSLLHN